MATFAETFADKLEGNAATGCVMWTGPHQTFGYGHATWEGRRYLTHRLAWELTNGPIPSGLCVLHECDNPPCVNPDHLFLGTKGDNNRDAARKGRNYHGPRHWNYRYPPEFVAEVRRLVESGVSRHEVSRRFGVSRRTIGRYLSGSSRRIDAPLDAA